MSGAATGGVLAMRAGAKAAGRNAVVGGVVMAAIEGLSLVLNRVLMPMFEKQQMEAGMEIDMLSPPKDPTWISHRRSKREPLFQPSSSGSLLYSPPGSSAGEGAGKAGGFQEGFTLDSVGTADMHSSEWELKQKREKEEAEAASSTEQKPFWKVW
jgi:import inner membrane translocase subunit TIM17